MNQLAENRKYPRMAVDCGIVWRPVDGDGSRTGVARNISGNGLLFVTTEQAAIGDRMEITLSPGVLSIPALSALVEVVRIGQGSSPPPAGIAPDARSYEIGARIMMMR